jgi:hypothetical protein
MNTPNRPSTTVDDPIESGSDDWDALAADWRAQPVTVVDPEALRRDVVRRGRWLRGWLALEIVLAVVTLGICAGATWWVQPPLFSPPAFLAVAAAVVGFQGWSLWIRRRQIRDVGLDARALLALERSRIDTSLRYWRTNAWVTVALWVALFAMLMAATGVGADEMPMTPRQAALALALNAPLVLAVAVFAWWWSRRCRARRGRVVALQAELDAD